MADFDKTFKVFVIIALTVIALSSLIMSYNEFYNILMGIV